MGAVDRLLQARAPRAFPDLHDKFWKATKTAGEAKKTNDVAVGERLLAEIADIDAMFKESKK